MDVRAQAVALADDGDRVVEVLRRLGIDRDRRQLAEVRAAFEARRGRLGDGLVRAVLSPLVEQSLEHGVDVIRGSEDALHTSAAAARADDGEIAGPGVAETVAIDDERYSRA